MKVICRLGTTSITFNPIHFPYKIPLFLHIWRPIASQNIVKPYPWWELNIGILPRIPRVVSLRLTIYKPPVNTANIPSFADGQDRDKSASHRSCHVFSAD